MKNKLLQNFVNKKDPLLKEEFHNNSKNIEVNSPTLWRKVNRLSMINVSKEIGITLRTHGKESNPLFLKNLQHLWNESSSTIFLQPTDEEEIANIIFSLNSNKACGPNSIPYGILFLLKKRVWSNWQIYSTSVFPYILKTAKVVPVIKND